jgi:hypothetical protein
VRTALTTNGVGLDRRAAELAQAGLDRVTISLDSLRRDRYLTITHRDRLHDVLAGVDAALAHGLGPVKVNALVVRGVNDDEAVELVRWACTTGVELRIIEHMPLDAQGAWDRAAMVTAEEVLAQLSTAFELEPVENRGQRSRGTLVRLGGRGAPRHRGRHRLGDPAVLRRLRPDAADGRRAGPQLPVLLRRHRPARHPAFRRRRPRRRRGVARQRLGQEGGARLGRRDLRPPRPADERDRWLRRPPGRRAP